MKCETIGNNLLPAIAYGDACGLPYETKPNNPELIINGLSSLNSNQYLEVPENLRDQKGIWSDDTHLSIATTLSLIESSGFDINNLSKYHIQAIESIKGDDSVPDLNPAIVTAGRNNGYGKSTIESIKRMKLGVSPYLSGNSLGTGNGVLMKMAPIIAWSIMAETEKIEDKDLIDFTRMTHAADESITSSLVHSSVLKALFNEDINNTNILEFAYEKSLEIEDKLENKKKIVSGYLGRIVGKKISAELIVDNLDNKSRGGLYAPETLMMAYSSFQIESEFPNSVYRAVELGGDTDSVASIIAAMSVFKYGSIDYPKDIEYVLDIDRIRRISIKLARTALNN